MKICYLARTNNIYFQRWYEFFINRGHEVHVISGDDSHLSIKVPMPDGVKVHYISEKKIWNQKISAIYNLCRLPLLIKELRKIIKEISPDIIHAHIITPSGLWGALSGFKPFVMTPAGSDVILLARKYLLYRMITRFVLKKADLITGDSMVLQDEILSYGINKDIVHLIQNGVDLTKFHQGIDTHKIREAHGIGDTPLIFSARGLSSKGITSIYNIDVIIRAMPKVLKKIPNAVFMFCYSQPDKEGELKELARNLGVYNNTRFIGYVDNQDIPFYQGAADINVSVPSSDSSPACVYEAMACGTPVIVSNIPWTKFFMKDRKNAFIVPPRDSEALGNAIVEVLTNSELRNKFIEGGLATVKEYVDYHKNMKMMENLMKDLVK